jgi:hypothetical protein
MIRRKMLREYVLRLILRLFPLFCKYIGIRDRTITLAKNPIHAKAKQMPIIGTRAIGLICLERDFIET